MKTEKIIGYLLIIGSVLLVLSYTLLAFYFDYPDILREDAGTILTSFVKGGTTLIVLWWLFAIVGLPVLEAYVLIGQKLDKSFYFIRWATTLAVISGIVQIVGLLRWSFVVPVLARTYVNSQNEAIRESCKLVFQAVHQYGGVVLGEHIGQLFTIAWVLMICSAFDKLKLIPKWMIWFGYILSGIYLCAQADLFATVIPGFPVWPSAGTIGSTLWLVWMFIIGIKFLKIEIVHPAWSGQM